MEDVLSSREKLKRFYALWKKANVSFSGGQKFSQIFFKDDEVVTVFAPMDDGFSNYEFKKLSASAEKAKNFVEQYIVKGTVLADL